MKIAFFHNECAPYRLPLFEKLSRIPNCDLKIYFGRYRSRDRKWNIIAKMNFDYEILREIRFLPELFAVGDEPNPLNPSLFFRLVNGQYDVFIGGVPSYFGTIITFSVAKLFKKPFILFLEDVDLPQHRTRSKAFFDLSFKNRIKVPLILLRHAVSGLIIRHSDAYVVPGLGTKDFLRRRGIVDSKIFMAPNCVDNSSIRNMCLKLQMTDAPRRMRKSHFGRNKIVLYVGHLLKAKGIEYLIMAYQKVREHDNEVSLVIVGDGPYREKLLKMSEDADDIIFTGYLDGEEKITYYLMADVFVLPTLFDVWGFVINEAMISGCPVITTRSAGCSADLVKNGVNGFIIEPRNVQALTKALNTILDDTSLRRKMGEKSRCIIRDYNYDNAAKGFERAIEYARGRVK